jgi:hypothetical protein
MMPTPQPPPIAVRQPNSFANMDEIQRLVGELVLTCESHRLRMAELETLLSQQTPGAGPMPVHELPANLPAEIAERIARARAASNGAPAPVAEVIVPVEDVENAPHDGPS